MKSGRGWLIALPGIVALVAYLPVLGHDLVWDDIPFLRHHPLYRVPELWQQALRQNLFFSSNYFRPLAVLTILGEMRLGADAAPAIFHLTNLLLHVANTVLVTLLARHLALRAGEASRATTFATVVPGLLYGLHPALTEAVAFISCRFDLLLTTFLLLALLADVTLPRRGLARPLAVGFAFLLAALSKEMAVAFLPVLPLWHMALARSRKITLAKPELMTYVALLAAGVVYLTVRYLALGYLLVDEAKISPGSGLQHLLLVARSLAEYGLIVIWPFTTLTPLHTATLPIPPDDVVAWASLAAVVAIAAVMVKLLIAKPQSGALLTAGSLSLLPVANIMALNLWGGAFVAERFLVFPLALFALGTVPWLRRPAFGRPRLGWVLAGLWLFAAVVTIERTLPHWRNEQTLWTWGAKRAPRSPIPPINLARYYGAHGDPERCLIETRRSLTLDPRADAAWNLAGYALMALKRYPEAQSAFERAVELLPQSGLYWSNLAGAVMEQGRHKEAERMFLEEALPRDPLELNTHLNIGILYLITDRPALAVPHLEEVLRLAPAAQRAEAQSLLDHARGRLDPVGRGSR